MKFRRMKHEIQVFVTPIFEPVSMYERNISVKKIKGLCGGSPGLPTKMWRVVGNRNDGLTLTLGSDC
jgi:hypothetical protein